MFIRIDLTSQVPIYLQIRSAIISAIAAGEMAAGNELPSVRRLAVDIGVNMHTVNKAYNMLRQDGYIEINRRSGAVISAQKYHKDSFEAIMSALLSTAAEACARGLDEKEFLQMSQKAYQLSLTGNPKEDIL